MTQSTFLWACTYAYIEKLKNFKVHCNIPMTPKLKATLSKNEDDLKNEDYLKNEDNHKNEDDLKN